MGNIFLFFIHMHKTLWFTNAQSIITLCASVHVGSQQHSSSGAFLDTGHLFPVPLEAARSPLWAMVSWLMPHFSVISVDSQKGEMYSYLYLTMWQANQWWLLTMIKTGHSFCDLESRCNYLKKPSHSVVILPRKVYCSSFWMEMILWSHMEAMQYCSGLCELESINADFLRWTKFFCSFTFWKYIIFLFRLLLSLPPSFPFSLSSV